MSTRSAQFSGQFYPSSPQKLKHQVKSFLNQANQKPQDSIKAIISPHAGYTYSGLVSAYSYQAIKNLNFNKVILVGSSHQYHLNQPVTSSFKFWQTPLGKVPSASFSELEINNQAHLNEHSLEVQIPFLQTVLKDFKIMPILVNQFDSNLVGKIKSQINSKTLIVSSTDLSHYHPYQQAKKIDQKTISLILNFKPKKLKNSQACGMPAVKTVLNIAQKLNWQPKLFKYLNSGDTSGPKNQVVGYLSMGFFKKETTKNE